MTRTRARMDRNSYNLAHRAYFIPFYSILFEDNGPEVDTSKVFVAFKARQGFYNEDR